MADLFIGLMSDANMGGIDAALVNLTSTPPHIVATHGQSYPARLRQQLAEAVSCLTTLEE